MSRVMSRRRLDPPQRAAVTVSVGAPLAAGVVYVAFRTDWLQRVGGSLTPGAPMWMELPERLT